MQKRQLGRDGLVVSAAGLGCMAMSGMYGPSDRAESIATIHSALDAGVNLLDTGDFYGMGHNELLISEALRERSRSDVVLSVKFGAMRSPDGSWLGYDARPAAVKNFLYHSLTRLNTDYIDIYRPSRLDPNVPIEETIGAIAEMVEKGYVRHIGLSEVGVETIRRAAAVHPIVDLQIEYSLMSRGIEAEILPACRELGIGITAYGVLSRGLLSGAWSKERVLAGSDFRSHGPRFTGENLDHNLELVAALQTIAEAKGASIAQIASAWVVAQGADIIPLFGARRLHQLHDSLTSLDINLNADELGIIERAIPKGAAAGERYNAYLMQHLDSER
ncbi:MAG TPA: aldo/keto reductase [Herpetosiphon sp.]|uniref:Aldo/keto reductase n=1 Tax=Herpetosiphon aurantiacus (strain ATCC 23779 / DSM 785 / 114-95) TaxID=316274 RepID=A9B0D7_HERA2|nr:aldo/keto reductase [Herpetosiphon sp.]ABX05246.1 aldo/keto reductase [Herpetosiphon aurantiacus DSM 785]HBW51244.1 aldo/keto reductase [Herpetosiphon sp.]